LQGIILDDQKQKLPGATVVIKLNSGGSWSNYSISTGEFSFPNLEPGSYSVSIELKGFKKVELKELVLAPKSKIRLEVILAVDSSDRVFTVT